MLEQSLANEERILATKKQQGAAQDSNIPEGHYANYFEIGYNAFEFVLDFGQHYDAEKKPRLHTRIILSPQYAKSLSDLLKQSIEAYEEEFGKKPE